MADPRTVLFAIAKNEGMFLVEWIAHNLSIGFDHVVVATNDCEDGTDQLLDAIGRVAPVTRLDNSRRIEGETIQKTGTDICLAHPETQAADWVMHMDVDEFLDLPVRVPDAVAAQPEADAIAYLWKAFGNDNRVVWDGGMVTEAFRSAAESPATQVTGHKTMFRPGSFRATSPHMPKQPTKPRSQLRVVNALGETLPNSRHYNARSAYKLTDRQLTWEGGCINHYQIKSLDLSLMKLLRGSANGRSPEKRRPGSRMFNKYNLNERLDYQIDRSRAARVAMHGQLMSVPEIAEWHEACRSWFLGERRRLLASVGDYRASLEAADRAA